MHFFPEKFESFFSNDLKFLCWLTSSCHALNIHLNLKHASSYRFRKKNNVLRTSVCTRQQVSLKSLFLKVFVGNIRD